MGCVLRGRSKALGVEGHLRQVGIQGYGRRPMDTLWDTMWIPYGVHCGDLGTLGGTLRTPGSSRETQERLKRDSRRDSRETRERQSPQLPKHGSQRARRVRWGQIQLTQAARAAATRERATRKERVGSELGHEDGVKEEGLSLRLMSVWSVILWDPLGTIGNPWVWKAIWGKCHVTWHVRMHGIKWVTMKTWHDITQPHTITPLRAALRGHPPLLLLLIQPSLNSSDELSAAQTQLSAALTNCQKGSRPPLTGQSAQRNDDSPVIPLSFPAESMEGWTHSFSSPFMLHGRRLPSRSVRSCVNTRTMECGGGCDGVRVEGWWHAHPDGWDIPSLKWGWWVKGSPSRMRLSSIGSVFSVFWSVLRTARRRRKRKQTPLNPLNTVLY